MRARNLSRIVLLLVLVLAVGFFGYSLYKFVYLPPFISTLTLEVIDGPSAEVLEEMVEANSQRTFIYFANTNPVPFYFLGPGENRRRELNVSNIYDFPIHVSAKIDGNLSSFVVLSESEFDLSAREERLLFVDVIVPKGAVAGDYLSKLTFSMSRRFD